MSRATITSPQPCTNRIDEPTITHLDLCGIRCPLSWAHAKVRLELMERGQSLRLLLDDPKAVRDIPRAAEAEGYAVLATGGEAPAWWILIQR